MISEPIKKEIIKFVIKKYQKEKDKWECGKKNNVYQWEDAYYEIYEFLYGDKK